MNDPIRPAGTGRGLTRRGVVTAGTALAGTAFLAPLLAACSSPAATSAAGKDAKANLVLSTWDIPADLITYRKFAAAYKKTHPGVTITVQKTPGGDFNQWLTTQLAGGSAPDIVRTTWQTFGQYAQNGGFIDLSQWVPASYGTGFQTSFWQAALLDGKPHAIPQHTDTFATYYNKEIFSKLNITPPASLDAAWSLDEFKDILKRVKGATGKYGMVYGFGGPNTAYRWLPFLYMMGGQLLDDDLKKPMIDSPEGVAALTWFSSLYKEGLIPQANSVKGANDAATLNSFTTGQVGLMLYGDWLVGQVGQGLDQSKWDVTFMPKDKSAASDLGGNLLAVSQSSKNPAIAADFLKFVCDEQNMKYFCENDNFLPIRKALSPETLEFKSYSPQMKTFVSQATTIPAGLAKVETSPKFNAVNQVLADQLDLCFVGNQSPAATAKNIASGITSALA